MNEISRLLTLVPYISSHQGMAISELAKKFDISEKELRKDLMTLFMCGLPGYTPLELMELEFEDGFVFIRNADTLKRPRAMTSQELILTILGLSLLAEIEESHRARIESLMEKLRALSSLPVAIAPRGSVTAEKRIVQSMRLKKKMQFKYLSRYSDEVKDHIVTALEIVSLENRNYLKSYSHSSSGIRYFDVARIQGPEILEESSFIPDVREERIAVEVKILRRYRNFIEFFTSERFETFSEKWVIRAILSAAGDVALLQPAPLRPQVARSAQVALAEYQRLG